jgi:hypothetical protein
MKHIADGLECLVASDVVFCLLCELRQDSGVAAAEISDAIRWFAVPTHRGILCPDRADL